MFIYIKKIQYQFLLIIPLFFEGCLHDFNKNGTYPLQLDVQTILENGKLKFKLKESHIELKNYYLNNIRITTSNNFCDEKYKKGLIIWKYQTKLPQEKISVLSPISYNGKALKKNTLYTIDISINKIQNSKIGRDGKGGGVFVITDKEDVLFGYSYDDINKLCKEY